MHVFHHKNRDLQRRGCVRTSFEFARLLFSLDPWTDPHGSLLHLDFLAIKSGMYQWLIDVFDVFAARRKERTGETGGRMDPSLLPGWSYARALALRSEEVAKKSKVRVFLSNLRFEYILNSFRTQDHQHSTDALKEAIKDFPSIVPLLADKIDGSLPASIRAHPDFKIQTDSKCVSLDISVSVLISIYKFALRPCGYTTPSFSSLRSTLRRSLEGAHRMVHRHSLGQLLCPSVIFACHRKTERLFVPISKRKSSLLCVSAHYSPRIYQSASVCFHPATGPRN